MDPPGKGTPKPDTIPEMMSAVAEIDNYRLNPDRYVSVRTIITCRYIQNNNAGIKVDVNLL
jgi:hypothetical protein